MGEAKRRKQKDPTFGKIEMPPPLVIKAWYNYDPIIVIRDEYSEDCSFDIITSGKEEEIAEIEKAKQLLKLSDPSIRELYLRSGRGIMVIMPSDAIEFFENSEKPINLDSIIFRSTYLTIEEIKKMDGDTIVLRNTNVLRPSLLWATHKYNPEKEVILLMGFIPINTRIADGSENDMFMNRCHVIKRYKLSDLK